MNGLDPSDAACIILVGMVCLTLVLIAWSPGNWRRNRNKKGEGE